MALDLSRVGERERQKIQREPHWQRLREGCFLGYRRSKRGGRGTWIARAYDSDLAKYAIKSLGDFGDLPATEIFVAARNEAEAFADLVQSGGNIRIILETVADACREYAKGSTEAAQRFKRHVDNDVIAKVRLEKLRRHHTKAWRDRLVAKPALVSRNKEGERAYRDRAPSTINRDMAILRAALAKVLAPGAPGSEAAWQEGLKAIPNANGRRTFYIDRAQRRKLVANADPEAAPFIRGLCLLPFRPGALAALTAKDFDQRTAELTIGKDKNGKPRRIKLPAGAAELFTAQVTGKSSNARIFTRANGKPWDKDTWGDAIAESAAAAELPHVVAYNLRHSTITDLVTANLPLLTIAQISGTSVEMIERHYGHLASNAAAKALAKLEL